ncbi:MAG TPA: hypothetical protein VGX23_19520 [Actinocrinis sp.]|nr:hypothetical protein [Actinocrinis sp.]
MELALEIAGAWLVAIVIVCFVVYRAGRRLNPHIPMPEPDEEEGPENRDHPD